MSEGKKLIGAFIVEENSIFVNGCWMHCVLGSCSYSHCVLFLHIGIM